jgi:hypothetical protein
LPELASLVVIENGTPDYSSGLDYSSLLEKNIFGDMDSYKVISDMHLLGKLPDMEKPKIIMPSILDSYRERLAEKKKAESIVDEELGTEKGESPNRQVDEDDSNDEMPGI